MATDLTKIINYNDPNFQKKYAKGVSIYNADEDKRYYYDPTAKTLTPYSLDAKYHDPYMDSGVEQIEYRAASGLAANVGSQSSQSMWEFINKETAPGYQQAANNNFGLGTNTTSFRPRAEGEDMTSYLRAKQEAELAATGTSTINNGGTIMDAGTASPEQIANPANQATSSNGRLLGPTEFTGLTKEWRASGLTNAEIEQNYITRDASGNIYLKSGALPTANQIIASRAGAINNNGIYDASQMAGSSGGAPAPTSTNSGLDNTTNYVSGVSQQLASTRATLESTYKTQLDKYQKEVDDYKEQIAALDKKTENVLDQAEDYTTPYREALEKSERERLLVEKNYFDNQAAVTEMESLLTDINASVADAKSRTGLAAIMSPRINKMIEDAAARVGVLEAVINLRNNQISTAFTMIDRTANAIQSDRTDKLNYFNSLLSWYSDQKSDIQSLLKTSLGYKKDIVNAQIALIENDMATAQESVNAVKQLMIESPEAVQGAGITLNDSLETISAKLAKYNYNNEIIGMKNDMVKDGYTYITDPSQLAGLSESQITRITDSKGVQRIYKNPPVKATGGGTSTQFSFSSDAKNKLLGANFSTTDINNLEQNIRDGFSINDIISQNKIPESQAKVLRAIFSGKDTTLDETTIGVLLQSAIDEDGNLDVTKLPSEQRIEIIKQAKSLGYFDEKDEETKSWFTQYGEFLDKIF